MKILFLTSRFPFPPTDGIRIKTYNLIKELSKKHQIFLLSFYENFEDVVQEQVSAMKQYCQVLKVVPIFSRKSAILQIFTELCTREPAFVSRFRSKQMAKLIEYVIATWQPDIVQLDGINISCYIPQVSGRVPCVISPNDSLTLGFTEEISFLPRKYILKKLYRYLQLSKIWKYERKMYAEAEKCYVVSEVDRNYLLALNPQIDVKAIANGVDAEFFKPLGLPKENPSLVYVADMSGGGADYAIWFIRQVFPKVKKVMPSVKFYLVGKNPKRKLLDIASRDNNIKVTGFVKDVRPYIDIATVVISPVMKTCGILNKVLQAMAMEKVVIGTSASFSGIKGAVSGKNMVSVDSAEEFAWKIVELSKDANLRKIIGKKARLLVKERYTWEQTAQEVERLYKEALWKFRKNL